MKPDLEFVFEIHVRLGKRMHTNTFPGGGKRAFVPVVGGEIFGPRLSGRVIPHSGGDWPSVSPDASAVFDARYLLEASDGTRILIKNRGIRHGTVETLNRILAGEKVAPSEYYMRLAPRFEAPAGAHSWLTRTIFIGTGERKEDHSVFRYWAIL
jgi:hypothetical protein